MDIWPLMADYGLFLAKTLTIVVAVIIVVVGIVSSVFRHRDEASEQIDVQKLNERFQDMKDK